ncbi:MAG: type II toxin-antitoxin system RelE/ParE family toxin [Methylobacter sp.]|uniref:Type II toxin-antitoxin system RelE/ParE family toxin n=1 Tax=Candidatus Methylobacter titanis TaxID=3053457 RepID=A0AA43Q4C3_9GAMM|nr:type II toxin-antitoxin system RelE/ParE family toxin [Candidatus Methylobacter titanis]
MTNKTIVQLTANFERNLESIEAFLVEAEAPRTYDALLDELLFTVIPNLERFPDMGRSFMNRPVRSVEVVNAVRALQAKLQNGALREYLLSDYLLLYARYDETIYLLSIKHHRRLSFDFAGHWPTT